MTPLVFAIMALLSALASTFLTGSNFDVIGFNVLPLPGVYFGFVLGLGAWLWCRLGLLEGVIIFGATLAAWLAAFQIAVQFATEVNIDIMIAGFEVRVMMAGFVAGAAGAGITYCGACFAAPGLWQSRRFYSIVAVGAALGLPLEPAIEGDGSLRLVLFLPWQVCVAALLGRYITQPVAPKPQGESDRTALEGGDGAR